MHTNWPYTKTQMENTWRGQHKHFKESVSSTSSLCASPLSKTKPLKDCVFHLTLSQPVGLKAAKFQTSMERYGLEQAKTDTCRVLTWLPKVQFITQTPKPEVVTKIPSMQANICLLLGKRTIGLNYKTRGCVLPTG